MKLKDLQDGDKFELVGGTFHATPAGRKWRTIRWIEKHQDTCTVCTTYCGETYTLESTTEVKKI